MSQTEYLNYPTTSLPAGSLAETGMIKQVDSFTNGTAAVAPFGHVVARAAANSTKFKRPVAATDDILGILVRSQTDNSSLEILPGTSVPFGQADTYKAGAPAGKKASVLKVGRAWVPVEDAVSTVSPVFMRITAAGSEELGALRGDEDGGDAILLKGARFLTSTAGAGLALVEVGLGELGSASAPEDELRIELTPGAEAGNAIEVVGRIVRGTTVVPIDALVSIKTVATTANKGAIAAAAAPVGTGFVALNPATGDNNAWMYAADGLFSFSVADDQAENVLVVVSIDNAPPKLIELIFA